LVDQNTAMKKEAGIAERKLLARNERILNLEQLLQESDRRLVRENAKYEAQLQALKERFEAAKGRSHPPSSFCAEQAKERSGLTFSSSRSSS
jgi:kinesin family protein 5